MKTLKYLLMIAIPLLPLQASASSGILRGIMMAQNTATEPTLSSATVPTAGNVIDLVYSAAVSIGAGGNGGVTVTGCSGGATTPTYTSGSGSTTLVYGLSRPINSGETGCVTGYTQPVNGIEATSGGADVASYSSQAVTNNSTQGSGCGTGFDVCDTFANLTNWTTTYGTPAVASNQYYSSGAGNTEAFVSYNTQLTNAYRQYVKMQVSTVGTTTSDVNPSMYLYTRSNAAQTIGYYFHADWSDSSTTGLKIKRATDNTIIYNFGILSEIWFATGNWIGYETENTGASTIHRIWFWTSDPGARTAWGTATHTQTVSDTQDTGLRAGIGQGTNAGTARFANFYAGSSATP